MRSRQNRILLAAIIAIAMLSACQGSAEQAGAPGSGSPGDRAVSDTPGDTPTVSTSAMAVRGAISGRVLTPDGSPVVGATVQPRSLDTPARPVPEMAVSTDRNGGYQWSLDPGRYEITILPPTGTAKSPTVGAQVVTVVAGQTATVNVTLS